MILSGIKCGLSYTFRIWLVTNRMNTSDFVPATEAIHIVKSRKDLVVSQPRFPSSVIKPDVLSCRIRFSD
jgi:hypothetical protein